MMKRFMTVVVVVALLVNCISVCSAQQQYILPQDDLWIKQDDPDENFSTVSEADIQNTGKSNYNGEAWFRFNLADFKIPKGKRIKSATLSVYFTKNSSYQAEVGQTQPGLINLYSLTSSEYDAAAITYNTANRPKRDRIIASEYIEPKNTFKTGYINFDVSHYVQMLDADAKVAFSLFPEHNVKAYAASVEHSDCKPRLTITLEDDFYRCMRVIPSEEALSGDNIIFDFSFFSPGDENPVITDSDGYRSFDITGYAASLMKKGENAGIVVDKKGLTINSEQNKPYIDIVIEDNTVTNATLNLYGADENTTLYDKNNEAIAQGGTGAALDITVGGYTEEKLLNTFYMAEDPRTAYPEIPEIEVWSFDEIAGKLSSRTRPYVIASDEDFQRIINGKNTDEYLAKWYSTVEEEGEKYLAATATEHNGGGSGVPLYTNAENAAHTLAFLYRTCNDEEKKEQYAKKCIYYLEALASYPDFNPSRMLDVGEIAGSASIAFDWIYDYDGFSDKQKEAISSAIIKNAIDVIIESPHNQNNNWNFVVNGGVLTAALSLYEYAPQKAYEAICQTVKTLPQAMRLYCRGNSFIEASGYFGYATEGLTTALASLDCSLGTDFGLSEIDGLSSCGYFPIFIRGGNDNIGIYYGDGIMSAPYSPGMYWYTNKFNNTDFGMYQRQNDEGSVLSLLWYKPELYVSAREISSLPNDVYSNGVTPYAALNEDRSNPNGLFAGLKGGFNQMSHGDLDIGSFYIGAFGKSFTKELEAFGYGGSSDKTADMPSSSRMSRYTYYPKSPQGHNTITVNQSSYYPAMTFGQELKAYCGLSEFKSGQHRSYAVLDMTDAYSADVERALRGIMLDRENERIILTDRIVPKKNCDIWWFMHTDAKISVNGKKAELTIDGDTLYAEIISDTDAEFCVMASCAVPRTPSVKEYDYPEYAGKKKLTVRFKAEKEEELQISFSVKENDAAEFLPLDCWKTQSIGRTDSSALASGEIYIPGRLDDVTAFVCNYDGNSLKTVKLYPVEDRHYTVPLTGEATIYLWNKKTLVPVEFYITQ